VNRSKRRPSISDVARLAGVSIGTVSNVLNTTDKVKPATVDRVLQAIEQLGFVRNDAARQLKAGKSQTIGLIVPDISNPFFTELARGAEQLGESDGYSVLIGNTGHDAERERGYFNLFEQQRVGGIVVSPTEDVTEQVVQLRKRGTNAVLVDRKAESNICCSVSMDDFAGGKLAMEHLLEQGHSEIIFVGGPADFQQVADRLAGAKSVVKASKGRANLKHIKTAELTVLAGREVGQQISAESRKNWPDAIFAANDLLAVGILQAFAFQAKVRVPEDIALIGYDDIDFAETAIVPLSSVRQPASLLGATAVELLVDEVERGPAHKHRQITFQPELIVRESSSKPASD
jgi:LacI family transcriptional regulator